MSYLPLFLTSVVGALLVGQWWVRRRDLRLVERAEIGTDRWAPLPGHDGAWMRVGPEPDWPARVLAAFRGELADSWSQEVGAVPAPGGRLVVGEPASLDRGVPVTVEPGSYAVRITVAQRVGSNGSVDDERVSHAFAQLAGEPVSHIEPVDAEGAAQELGVDSGLAAIATPGASDLLAAERSGGDVELLEMALIEQMRTVYRPTRDWTHAATADGGAALALFSSGEGDGTYPVYRMLDADRRVVGVAIDLLIDNIRD